VMDRWGRQRAIAPCSKLHMAHQIFDFVRTLGEPNPE
jgi:hypothetical protein